MKKICLFLTALLLTLASGAQTAIKGDVNGDGTVDVADVTEVVNIILNPDSDDTPSVTAGTAIDLGLSVKWASCNVGAENPWEYGGYYAWGEMEERSDYDWNFYKYCDGSYITMTKYCIDSRYGTIDDKITLESGDDVAAVEWGGNWRMPTLNEMKELLNNCTWTWTTLNGVNGYRITGSNGNSIFLPASGSRHYDIFGDSQSFVGCYWSSLLSSIRSDDACGLYFDGSNYEWRDNSRCFGLSVRPVCP